MGEKPNDEDRLYRINRALRMVNACNQILIQEKDEKQLLDEICRIIVEIGGYHLVWIGFTEQDNKKTILPVAHRGYEDGYFDTLKKTWANIERGRGPTGTAIRTEKPVICRDILSNPAFTPWRDDAVRRGYQSSIAVPLKAGDEIMGALNIYAEMTDAFDGEEVELLNNLGNELVYGIMALRTRLEKEISVKAFHKNQTFLNQTQRITKAGGWEYDVAAGRMTWTDEVYRIYGVSKSAFDPNNIEQDIQFYAPEDQQTIREAFRAALEKGESYDLEMQFYPADGRKLWVRTVGQVDKKDGKIVRVFGNIVDITERKQAEAALRENEERYQNTLDNMLEGCQIIDYNWRYLYVNDTAARHGRKTKEKLLGHTMMEVYLDIENSEPFPFLRRCMEERIPHHMESEFTFPEGDKGWFELYIQPVAEGILVLSLDITERKRTEDALRRSEEKYRELAENLNDVIYSVNAEGTITYVSPPVESVLGHTPADLVGKNYAHLVHTDDLDTIHRVFEDVLQGRIYPSELRMRTKSGEYHWVRTSSRPVLEGKRVVGLQGVLTDINEHKRADEALRESERILNTTGKKGKIGGWEHDFVTGKAIWTQALYDIIEIPYDQEPPGVNEHFGYYPPRDREILEQAYNQAVKKGIPFDLELQVYTSKKKLRWCRAQGDPVFENGKCMKMRGIFQDITDRKRMEEDREKLHTQFLQAQKMESVGRLAGGVAHDFNNMLSVIIGHSELALDGMDPKEPFHADIQEILKSAKRSAAIIRQLLAFARKQTIAPKVLDLNYTVEGMLKMLRRLIGENIELAWLPMSKLWPVHMDPGQIDQILANLCVNARDAISRVGQVTIETKNMVLNEAYCAENIGYVPGEYVMLGVSDNGCGMDKETLDKVFEPFFTTKELGKGTGLGLATVYGIVKQNQGFINVYSEPDKGTTFKIYLPRYGQEAVLEEVPDKMPLGRGETILIVEDEVSVLDVGKRILRKLGYTVLAVGMPDEAMEMARQHAGEIHLLMTDVVMPEMSGKELAEQITKICTNIKILFMSGYTANAIVHHGILDKGVHFIHKPFTSDSLARKVREVLEIEY